MPNNPRKLQVYIQYDLSSDSYSLAVRVRTADGVVRAERIFIPLNYNGDTGAFFNLVASLQGIPFHEELSATGPAEPH